MIGKNLKIIQENVEKILESLWKYEKNFVKTWKSVEECLKKFWKIIISIIWENCKGTLFEKVLKIWKNFKEYFGKII